MNVGARVAEFARPFDLDDGLLSDPTRNISRVDGVPGALGASKH
jgi:hypothetical protein